jgi:hypothetical protein
LGEKLYTRDLKITQLGKYLGNIQGVIQLVEIIRSYWENRCQTNSQRPASDGEKEDSCWEEELG